MVGYALLAALLPLALANMNHGDMQGMGTYGVQMEGMMQMGQMSQQQLQQMQMMKQYMMQNGGQQMQQGGSYGHQQMGGQMGGQQMQQGGQNGGEWWGMTSEEDKEAYLKWCEERKLQMKEQEEAQALLKQITQQAEMKKREHSREKMMKEAKMKRENMVSQWRMWQSQLKQTEEYDESMNKYSEMKVKYMFSLTMDYLKFCKCSDYTGPLQRYLRHGEMTYEPGMSEAYDLSELDGVDLNDEEAVAQRMATLPDSDQIKLYFTGMIMTTCDAVKAYVDQLKAWEVQYNFMGM